MAGTSSAKMRFALLPGHDEKHTWCGDVQAALLTFSTFTPPPSSTITLLRSFTSA
jgi:hypothetical protein